MSIYLKNYIPSGIHPLDRNPTQKLEAGLRNLASLAESVKKVRVMRNVSVSGAGRKNQKNILELDLEATFDARRPAIDKFTRAYLLFSRNFRDDVTRVRIGYSVDSKTNEVTLLAKGKPYDPAKEYSF